MTAGARRVQRLRPRASNGSGTDTALDKSPLLRRVIIESGSDAASPLRKRPRADGEPDDTAPRVNSPMLNQKSPKKPVTSAVFPDKDDLARKDRKSPADSETRSSTPNIPSRIDLLELKKITDLRQSGENQQFCDDIQYLMDGLDGSSLVLRRSCLVDLLRSCPDVGFLAKFRSLGFLEQFLRLIKPEEIANDTLSSLCYLLICCAFSANDSPSANMIAGTNDLIKFLTRLIIDEDKLYHVSAATCLKKKREFEMFQEIAAFSGKIIVMNAEDTSNNLSPGGVAAHLLTHICTLATLPDILVQHFANRLDDLLNLDTPVLHICEQLTASTSIKWKIAFLKGDFLCKIVKAIEYLSVDVDRGHDLFRILINLTKIHPESGDTIQQIFGGSSYEDSIETLKRLIDLNLLTLRAVDHLDANLITCKLLTCFIVNILDDSSDVFRDFFANPESGHYTQRLLEGTQWLLERPQRTESEDLLLFSYYMCYLSAVFIVRAQELPPDLESMVQSTAAALSEFASLLDTVINQQHPQTNQEKQPEMFNQSLATTNDRRMAEQFHKMAARVLSRLQSPKK